ncbi:MAG: acetyl-CoA carboxylase biotin carboxyl carrier protein [Gemmatimonadetes bacterium]|nr:acetyl-CoA carboxylase biotin carboxyl carrier protein [Gemmatimonadota bacterium]
MDLKFLKGLIRVLDESGIDSIEITRGGTRIRLAKTPPPAPVVAANPVTAPAYPDRRQHADAAVAPAEARAVPALEAAAAEAAVAEKLVEVKSPMVGTFYRAPAPDAPPYVEVGSRVSQGDTLCVIEAMKLMNELESEAAGVIGEICADNAEPVEYGQVLFRIKPL